MGGTCVFPRANGASITLSIVISARKAAQYFPGENPIGKSLIINDELEKPYVISGVMRDMPIQSHLVPIDFLVTLTEVEFWQGEQQYWRANNYHTYVRLQEGTDVADLEQKLLGLVDKYYLPILLSVLISSGPFLRHNLF